MRSTFFAATSSCGNAGLRKASMVGPLPVGSAAAFGGASRSPAVATTRGSTAQTAKVTAQIALFITLTDPFAPAANDKTQSCRGTSPAARQAAAASSSPDRDGN